MVEVKTKAVDFAGYPSINRFMPIENLYYMPKQRLTQEFKDPLTSDYPLRPPLPELDANSQVAESKRLSTVSEQKDLTVDLPGPQEDSLELAGIQAVGSRRSASEKVDQGPDSAPRGRESESCFPVLIQESPSVAGFGAGLSAVKHKRMSDTVMDTIGKLVGDLGGRARSTAKKPADLNSFLDNFRQSLMPDDIVRENRDNVSIVEQKKEQEINVEQNVEENNQEFEYTFNEKNQLKNPVKNQNKTLLAKEGPPSLSRKPSLSKKNSKLIVAEDKKKPIIKDQKESSKAKSDRAPMRDQLPKTKEVKFQVESKANTSHHYSPIMSPEPSLNGHYRLQEHPPANHNSSPFPHALTSHALPDPSYPPSPPSSPRPATIVRIVGPKAKPLPSSLHSLPQPASSRQLPRKEIRSLVVEMPADIRAVHAAAIGKQPKTADMRSKASRIKEYMQSLNRRQLNLR